MTSFQAFHWFEFDKSLREFCRVLKPSGRLALIWSLWDQKDTIAKAYTRLILEASQDSRLQPQFSTQSLISQLRCQLFWQGVWLPYFIDFKRREFKFNQQLDLAGLIGLAYSQGFTPSEGLALEGLVAKLSKLHHEFADARGQVQLADQTCLYLATSPNPQMW